MTASPLDAAAFKNRVNDLVTEVLTQEADRLASISPDLTVLTDALTPFLTAGKRLRPAFCYWGWRGAGGNPGDAAAEAGVMKAATSLEFLQACALIHDDVMDGSKTRRGLPAIHHMFANIHRGSQWLGSSESFGVSTAILLGDLCLSWADQTLMSADLPADALLRAKSVYDEMRTELMGGQYLDLLEQVLGGGSAARASRVVQYKSAKYTVERPLHIGAALHGSDPAIMTAYSEFGLPLGEAFQLRDDVLGVFGDPAETGKPAGDDLREGKRTIMLALAFDLGSKAQKQALRQHVGDPALSDSAIDTLRAIIIETGALARTEELISLSLGKALNALDRNPTMPDEARQALLFLAHAATNRKD